MRRVEPGSREPKREAHFMTTLTLNAQDLKTVPDLVAGQAAATPESLALAAGDRRLTYGDLEARAEWLANRLCSLGVAPGDIVGLCFGSSPAMIVGALGILKAGGAYLALDPSLPSERLGHVLNDARPRMIVTAENLAGRLPQGDWRLATLDPEGREGGAQPPERQRIPRPAESSAYVIYTSGSTGRPKGVELTHGGLLNLVRWHRRAFAITSKDRATQIAGVGFDAAVWEVWPYLASGASVHIPDESKRQQPEALRDWLVAEEISITFLPTPMAERMMALSWPAGAALRTMLTGADTLHRYPPPGLPFAVVNNYGPTECTVVTTSGQVRPNDDGSSLPSIGRPIDGVTVHVLDEGRRPVEPGEVGELYIGGAGVGRGYLNLPDLTAERFISDPWASDPSARLYRSGDLARLLPDGSIAFLGRMDDQIKIRGYRIEPAEIVAALNQHPEVKESVVVALDAGPGDRRLVAYIVPAAERRPVPGALRDFLGIRLPEYMVPATFALLPSLPLNANGKVDRASLPPLGEADVLQDDEYVAPRSPVEERVAGILASLLGIERVGVLDNFFMLGGHSMLGTQLITRLREVFSVPVALRTIFERPTVAALSAEIERLLLQRLEAMSEDEAARMLG
jgi:amino acid adenylation domain-containing protein